MSENCTHNCETCGENCASRKTNPADFREPPHALSSIKKVIGVVSGKGGVGKSMTSAMLAVLLNRRGYKTSPAPASLSCSVSTAAPMRTKWAAIPYRAAQAST